MPASSSMIVKNCPFCGAGKLDKVKTKGVYVYQDTPNNDVEPCFHVICLECGSASPSIEIWNSRKATN